jgi:GTP 3',8-cyclase
VEDLYGHHISYLRVSVTDRCNERCTYCMPDEQQEWFPREEVLSFEEMLRVISVGAGLGIQRVRVTGGEPLTRPGVVDFCRAVANIPGIRDVGISTNGTLLSKTLPNGESTAQALVKAGVRSANISLDSMDRASYLKTTGRDLLPKVLEGITSARAAGFPSIKINSVLTKHQSEQELIKLVEFAREQDALLRFIELMPVTSKDVLTEDSFLSCGIAKKIIEQHTGPLLTRPDIRTNGPASYHEIPGSGQMLGFIGAMTNLHFCESCNKLRLTCDGKLRPCLGSYLEFDLREALRANCSDAELKKLILHVVARKPKEHDFRTSYVPGRKMIAIGG